MQPLTDPMSLWLGTPAPRYTSYPPATQFKPIDDATARSAEHLVLMAESQTPVSLYVHIPFCRELCLFCGCHTVITNRKERETAYLEALHHEIDLVRQKLGKSLSVAHLHFGGGSPSTLSPRNLNALMRRLQSAFHFLPGAELAMELDPRTTDRKLITALVEEGINRVSLGVQDVMPDVQRAINRIQPFEKVAETTALLRASGIKAISFDLMYGLPHQTSQSIAESTLEVLSLHPSRLSLFAYAHVPAMKPHQRGMEKYGLPDNLTRIELEQAARRVIEADGFIPIGMDHFARPDDPLARALKEGRLARNFQGYTDDPATQMLGLGASAISDVGTMMIQNDPDLENYQKALGEKRLPLKRLCRRSPDDIRRESIISSLMCNFEAEVPIDLKLDMTRLAPMIESGLVHWQKRVLKVDTTYRMAVRYVATLFDETYAPETLSSRIS